MSKKFWAVILVVVSLAVGALGGFYGAAQLTSDVIYVGNKTTTTTSSSDTDAEDKALLTKINSLKNTILNSYYTEVDEEDLNEGILKGLVEGLDDPYSEYLTEEDLDEFLSSFEEEAYAGVGMVMQADYTKGLIRVIRVLPGSPAEEGGVVRGDYIVKADGVEYGAQEMDECAAAIRGEADTQVTVQFYHNGQLIDKTFTRKELSVPSVYYSTLTEYNADNIAYIEVTSFAEDTADEFEEALKKAEAADVEAIIIDIRDNTGGLVDAAISMSDMLMDAATVVYTQDHDGNKEYYTTKNGTVTDKEIVLLVNEYSASSSEIFAAGLQENKRATLVGTQTFGKGIIQQIMYLSDGTGLKLTKWQYFTATGKAIHKVGITPDYVVEFTDEDYDENGYLIEDTQILKAIEVINNK